MPFCILNDWMNEIENFVIWLKVFWNGICSNFLPTFFFLLLFLGVIPIYITYVCTYEPYTYSESYRLLKHITVHPIRLYFKWLGKSTMWHCSNWCEEMRNLIAIELEVPLGVLNITLVCTEHSTHHHHHHHHHDLHDQIYVMLCQEW